MIRSVAFTAALLALLGPACGAPRAARSAATDPTLASAEEAPLWPTPELSREDPALGLARILGLRLPAVEHQHHGHHGHHHGQQGHGQGAPPAAAKKAVPGAPARGATGEKQP